VSRRSFLAAGLLLSLLGHSLPAAGRETEGPARPRLHLAATTTAPFVGQNVVLTLLIDLPLPWAERLADRPDPSLHELPRLDVPWLTVEYGFVRQPSAEQWLCLHVAAGRGIPLAVEPLWFDIEKGMELDYFVRGPLLIWAEAVDGAPEGLRRFRLSWSLVPETETRLVFRAVRLEWPEGAIESGAVELDVKKPPELLDPGPRLNLGVGRLNVVVALESHQTTIGREVELAVAVSGDAALDRLARPPLARLPEFRQGGFDLRAGTETWSADGKTRVFRYLLTPRQSGAMTIPPIPWACFDPLASPPGYIRRSTRSFQLTVHPAVETVRRPPRQGSDNLPARLQLRGEGGALLRRETGWPAAWIMAVGLLVPPLAWFACWVGLRWGDVFLAAVGKRRYGAAARRALRELCQVAGSPLSAQAEGVSRTLQGYLETRFGAPRGELTPAEVDRLLSEKGIAEASRCRLRELLARSERARFGAGDEVLADLVAAAANLVVELEREC